MDWVEFVCLDRLTGLALGLKSRWLVLTSEADQMRVKLAQQFPATLFLVSVLESWRRTSDNAGKLWPNASKTADLLAVWLSEGKVLNAGRGRCVLATAAA